MLGLLAGEIDKAAHDGGLCHEGDYREGRWHGQLSCEEKRQCSEACRQMNQAHRHGQRFLRAAQTQKLRGKGDDKDHRVEQIDDNLMAADGVSAPRPQEVFYPLAGLLNVHHIRLLFIEWWLLSCRICHNLIHYSHEVSHNILSLIDNAV